MMNGQGEWHRLIKFLCEKRKSKKKRVNKRKIKIIMGGVNLVISIAMVQKMGLAGVYIGTIVSGLIANVTKPFIIYGVCFGKKAGEYFVDTAKNLVVMGIVLVVILPLGNMLLKEVTFLSFILMGICIVVIYNVVFLLAFGRTKEMGYLLEVVKRRVKR